MPASSIHFSAKVHSHRAERRVALNDGFDSMLAWVEGPALTLPIHRMTDELATRMMGLALLGVAWWLTLRLPTSGPAELCHKGARYLFAGWGSEPVRTRFGVLHFSRPIYIKTTRWREVKIAPFDRLIGLAAGRMSFDVHLLVAALVARLPFQQCHDVMKLFGGYTPAPRSMHGIVDGLGPIAAKYMTTLPAPDDDGEILVIEVDHKGAPHMGPEEHRRRQRKHTKRPRGLHRHFPRSVPCLDWYHLSEYLWTAAGAVYRDRTKKGKASKAAWVAARHRDLRAGEVDTVLEALEALFKSVGKCGPGTAARRKSIQSAVTYITNQRDHMPYQELRAAGLPIGSGNIEGTAKYIGTRLDGGGMRWSKERAAHVLALRCVLASHEWEGFAEAAIEEHERRTEPEVARLTPSTLMTPHRAAKKAA